MDDSLANLHTIEPSAEGLAAGTTIKDLQLPKGSLVMFVLRDGRYSVPNSKLKLLEGDKLLIVEETSENTLPQD